MSKGCRQSLIKYHTTYYGTRPVSLASNVTRTPKSSERNGTTRSDAVPTGSGRRDHPPDVTPYPSFDRSLQSLRILALEDVITLDLTPRHPYFFPNDHVTGDSIRFDPIADSNGNLNFVIILSNDRFYGGQMGSFERTRVAIVTGEGFTKNSDEIPILSMYEYL